MSESEFVKTGQDGYGTVEGYYRPKSTFIQKLPPARQWTVTPNGHLMYKDRPVADVRYAAAREQIHFMLDALNAAEEKR
jgi:hypothetical protein